LKKSQITFKIIKISLIFPHGPERVIPRGEQNSRGHSFFTSFLPCLSTHFLPTASFFMDAGILFESCKTCRILWWPMMACWPGAPLSNFGKSGLRGVVLLLLKVGAEQMSL
jgi:hypothetical protein